MSIQILKADVIDQIAAGEVVERPAHLVKELVENSLDAGATRVEIEVSAGGRNIRVSDDGTGMIKEDLVLACARHATSKIRVSNDLWSLHTFGFRGEALASIGAVSDLRITSRHSTEKSAYSIDCRFGALSAPASSGTQPGTIVEVKDLFENVPARLKFLKSEVAEISQIKNCIKAIALAHPHVEFLFKANSKLQFLYSRAESLLLRTQDVMEEKDLFFAEHEVDGYRAEIVYSSPNTTVKTSRQIWVYVQNRWVNDKTIQAAVMESYRNLLMHGEFPIAVVKILAPTGDVDVNIHPTKSQVKFLEQSRIFKLVHYTLRRDLERARWIDTMRAASFDQDPESEARARVRESTEAFVTRSTSGDANVPTSLRFSDSHFERTQHANKKMPLEFAAEKRNESVSFPSFSRTEGTAASTTVDENQKPDYLAGEEPTSINPPAAFWSLMRVVGQAHLTYIVAESPESLFLIDLHAAHERVMFERLMESYSKHQMDVQNFLIPIAVDMPAEHCEIVLKQTEQLAKMGVSLASGGPETLMVESAPSWISDRAIVDALTKFAEEVARSGGSFTWEKKLGDIFATMACHSAIRAGHAMSHEEMVSLLQQMDDYKLSSYCPHGRNVYVEIPKTKLERDFGRIV